MTYQYNFDVLRADMPNGAFELFCAFSRFEYALKAHPSHRYCRPGPGHSTTSAWERLASDLTEACFDDIAARGVAPTIREQPPKRQVALEAVDGYAPEWETPPEPTTTKSLIDAVKRVRNNLFHGGKHGTPDFARDPLLIAEALEVLGEILSRDEDLERLFAHREGP